MKIRAIIGGVCASALLSAAAARAQSIPAEPFISVGVMAGASVLTGPFAGSDFANGYALGISALIALPNPHFALRGDVNYRGAFQQSCKVNILDPQVQQANPCAGPEQLLAWSADFVARLKPRSEGWTPYLLVGAGLYTNLENESSTEPINHAGFQVGAGVESYIATGGALFVEARYMNYAPGGVVPVMVGIRF